MSRREASMREGRRGTGEGARLRGARLWIYASLLASVMGVSSGCGTLITQIDGPLFAPGNRAFDWDGAEASPIYSGTRLSWGGVQKSDVFYVWIVDLPFSFTADTLILPISLLQAGMVILLGEDEEEILTPEATPLP